MSKWIDAKTFLVNMALVKFIEDKFDPDNKKEPYQLIMYFSEHARLEWRFSDKDERDEMFQNLKKELTGKIDNTSEAEEKCRE